LPSAEDHEISVLRFALFANRGEFRPAGQPGRLRQGERSHQAARSNKATGQAPV
jgi:hypothetical protein